MSISALFLRAALGACAAHVLVNLLTICGQIRQPRRSQQHHCALSPGPCHGRQSQRLLRLVSPSNKMHASSHFDGSWQVGLHVAGLRFASVSSRGHVGFNQVVAATKEGVQVAAVAAMVSRITNGTFPLGQHAGDVSTSLITPQPLNH